MNAGLVRARFAAAHPPWPWLAGGLLALVAASLHLLVLPGAGADIEQAERQLARLEGDYRRLQMQRRLAESDPQEARLGLLERFPDDAQLHRELGRLIELAEREELQLPHGEYRLIPGKDKLFDRYVLHLPVQGSYGNIRRYLAAVRAEFPTLAIEDVTLNRESIASDELDAQLRLVIFARRKAAT